MEITKREILASISIIAIMLVIGFLIAGNISERQMDRNEKYNKALKIEDAEMFKYGMNTSIGNAFVYGDLKAINPVSDPKIDGEYLALEKVKEKHTMHTRTVTTTVNGKTRTRVETYWTWDVVGREKLKSDKVKFLEEDFNASQFDIPRGDYIDTVKESSSIRYKYYGYPAESKVTIFAKLFDKNIDQEDVPVYKDQTIQETVEELTHDNSIIVFWVIWIIVIGIVVYGFYYLDNKWLE